MIRVAITQVVLFLLPFIGYVLFRLVTGGDRSPFASRKVTYGLTMVGCVFVLSGFVYLALTGGTDTGTYVPTQFIDGQLVPGGFRSTDDAN